LGLSIVKSLVELHGGNVDVPSPGEGQGSTFIVRLRIAPVRRQGAPEDQKRAQAARSG
jgi:signal transduction histidine kinase